MTLNLQTLTAGQAIVDKKGGPTPKFILDWQRNVRSIELQEASQQQLIEIIQAQTVAMAQLLLVVAENVVYLNNLGAWLIQLGDFSNLRIAYNQICIATVATATGTTLPPPVPPLPPYPGPPPSPPWP